MQQLLVIIPTYNESDNIRKIISEIFSVCNKLMNWSTYIMVVDDNSPDGTANIVSELQDTYTSDRLRLVTGKKAGLGKAYIRGFEHGLKIEGIDVFVMMDADFSHDPHAIPSLLAAADEGADYVIGSRYVHGGTIPGNWPLMRIINSRIANFIAHLLTDMNKNVLDVTGGFKAISANAMKDINLDDINAAGYVFQVSLLHEFMSKGKKVTEVPIKFVDRQYGVSKLKVRDVIEFIYRAYKLNPQSKVSRFFRFGLVGACGTVVNLAVLTGLVHLTTLSPYRAVLVAIEVSILSNFFMNHYFTFKLRDGSSHKDSRSTLFAKLLKFNLGAVGGALIAYVTFALLHGRAHLHYVLADILAIILAMGWNYWMSTKVVWKMVDAHS